MRLHGHPVWYVLLGILSVQFGASIAKHLFDEVAPTTVLFLRLASSALVLLAVVRPSLRHRSRADWLVALGFGASLGTMNWAIYESFHRIPLGLAVTIEFVGPLSIALLGSRRPRDLVWVLLAGCGVVLLGFQPEGITVAGVLFALLAGTAWGCYILLSASTGRRWPGLDGLTVASCVAALAFLPYTVATSRSELDTGWVLLAGAGVGLLSSVIPYSLELVALRTLRPSLFGILMSLEPAAAALAGLVVLQEVLTPLQCVAVACVIAASVGATRSGRAAVSSGESGRADADVPVPPTP